MPSRTFGCRTGSGPKSNQEASARSRMGSSASIAMWKRWRQVMHRFTSPSMGREVGASGIFAAVRIQPQMERSHSSHCI